MAKKVGYQFDLSVFMVSKLFIWALLVLDQKIIFVKSPYQRQKYSVIFLSSLKS